MKKAIDVINESRSSLATQLAAAKKSIETQTAEVADIQKSIDDHDASIRKLNAAPVKPTAEETAAAAKAAEKPATA